MWNVVITCGAGSPGPGQPVYRLLQVLGEAGALHSRVVRVVLRIRPLAARAGCRGWNYNIHIRVSIPQLRVNKQAKCINLPLSSYTKLLLDPLRLDLMIFFLSCATSTGLSTGLQNMTLVSLGAGSTEARTPFSMDRVTFNMLFFWLLLVTWYGVHPAAGTIDDLRLVGVLVSVSCF